MHEFKYDRHQQPGFRSYGLRPLPPPKPPLRASLKAYGPAVVLFLGGGILASVVITLLSLYGARVLLYLEDIAVGAVWLAVIIASVHVVRKIQANRRRRSLRSRLPARVHEDSPSRVGMRRSHLSNVLPPYPPEDFFSYDPLNKRPSEHFRLDQRNRF